jgi:hypothetical protein
LSDSDDTQPLFWTYVDAVSASVVSSGGLDGTMAASGELALDAAETLLSPLGFKVRGAGCPH